MNKTRRGFTLIEALSVVAIIGILISLTIYVVAQAQRQARDARRKSDITAIAQAFEARYLDQTCPTAAQNIYPGRRITLPSGSTRWPWLKVSSLYGASDDCNPFSYYLPTAPEDPHGDSNSYYFNLSAAAGEVAKHYRLTARLERDPNTDEVAEICRQSLVWYEDFQGERYDGCGANSIQGYLGLKLAGIKLAQVDLPSSDAPVSDVGESPSDDLPGGGVGSGSGAGPGGGSGSGGAENNPLSERNYNYYIGR